MDLGFQDFAKCDRQRVSPKWCIVYLKGYPFIYTSNFK
jgi:hypothetical protein